MSDAFFHIKQCLAKNLRTARLEAGLSQEKLALETNVDRTYVSQLERALVNPSLSVLTRLAEHLDISVPELLADNSLD